MRWEPHEQGRGRGRTTTSREAVKGEKEDSVSGKIMADKALGGGLSQLHELQALFFGHIRVFLYLLRVNEYVSSKDLLVYATCFLKSCLTRRKKPVLKPNTPP